MERKLAYIEEIQEIQEIRLKDSGELSQNITMYRVLGWWVVGKRGEFLPGQKVIYIEIDSKVPSDNEHFSFLEQKGYKVKTMKLNKFYFGEDKDRTVISQGLIVPMSVAFGYNAKSEEVGTDVTKLLKITKVEDDTKENKVPRKIDSSSAFYHRHYKFFRTRFGRWLKGKRLFQHLVKKLLVKTVKPKAWPFYITKTDEERIQNRPWVLTEYAGKPMQVTEKLDGTSTTFGLLKTGKGKFDFAVCSRNVRQLDRKQMTWYKDAEVNFYWEMADKYNIEKVMNALFDAVGANEHIYLQGETIGPSIQGNKYKLAERQFRPFNLVIDGKKVDSKIAVDMVDMAQSLAVHNGEELLCRLQWVPILDADNTVSFKVISPEFLIKWGL